MKNNAAFSLISYGNFDRKTKQEERKVKKKTKIINVTTGFLIAALLAVPPLPAESSILINGAGATFPYPIYSKWFSEYSKTVDSSVDFNYQSIGSGGGIKQISARTVDF